MPVVPAPAEDEMPRMEIALVAELSIDTPGVKRAMSRKSLMPFWSMSAWVKAVTLIGTLLSSSSRRVAVTTTSCSPSARGPAAPPVTSCAAGAAGPAAPVGLAASAACDERIRTDTAASGGQISEAMARFEFFMVFPPGMFSSPGNVSVSALQQHGGIGAPAHEYLIVPVDERFRCTALVLRKHGD